MAFHIRRQLRDVVVAALKGHTSAGENVWAGRTWPIAQGTKAALLVYFEGGPSLFEAMGASPTLARNERLVVQAVVRTRGVEPEDSLHALAAEIEPLIAAAAVPGGTIGAIALAAELVNTEIQAQADGDDRAGEMRLTYSLPVRTTAADPTTAL